MLLLQRISMTPAQGVLVRCVRRLLLVQDALSKTKVVPKTERHKAAAGSEGNTYHIAVPKLAQRLR